MDWTVSNLAIQIFAGVLGANALAVVIRNVGFRLLAQSLIGGIGGTFGGLFLQNLALTMVTATGSQNVNRYGDIVMLNVLSGLGSGAALLLGLAIAREHFRSGDNG